MKTAFITGVTGQDGAYLSQLLLSMGYRVVGLQRRSSNFLDSRWRLRELGIEGEVEFVDGDLTDVGSLTSALEACAPDEVYNLAAQSFVVVSWRQPALTAQVTGVGALHVFEACRQVCPSARIYQAGSSEMFGNAVGHHQNEETPFKPRSPYGVAKVFAHQMAVNYRESYDMFIANGILFNHESPLRGVEFVTRKVCRGAARIKQGLETELRLGNLKARRDWGHARDYVRGMWMMLQQATPEDFVLATGRTQSVEEFCVTAFESVGLDWRHYVVTDSELFRPTEVDVLLGNAEKAERVLGWTRDFSFGGLVADMVGAEMVRAAGEA